MRRIRCKNPEEGTLTGLCGTLLNPGQECWHCKYLKEWKAAARAISEAYKAGKPLRFPISKSSLASGEYARSAWRPGWIETTAGHSWCADITQLVGPGDPRYYE